jgi:hypothetical protein
VEFPWIKTESARNADIANIDFLKQKNSPATKIQRTAAKLTTVNSGRLAAENSGKEKTLRCTQNHSFKFFQKIQFCNSSFFMKGSVPNTGR